MEAIARALFWGAIIAMVGACYTFAQRMASYNANQSNTYSAPHIVPAYADTDEDGFVPAQGDPLYDAHYAENVNVPNSQALQGLNQIPVLAAEANLIQAQAEQVEAETERIRQDAKVSQVGAGVTLFIVAAVFLLLIVLVFR